MKLVFPDIHQPIVFEDGFFSSLVIENPRLLYRLISDFKNQLLGMSGMLVLSEKDEPIAISKNIELITDVVNFDINTKTLLTKIISALEKQAIDEEHIGETNELLAYIERYIFNLTDDFDVELRCDKISANSVLKSVGISIVSDFDSPLDAFHSYIQLVNEYMGTRVFVFLNMRGFFTDDEIQSFVNMEIGHDNKILLLDNKAYPLLENEKRLIIDADLCEI